MESMFEDLLLSKDDEKELILDFGDISQQPTHAENSLIGWFLTDRLINFIVNKNYMASIWRPGKGIYVQQINLQLFLF